MKSYNELLNSAKEKSEIVKKLKKEINELKTNEHKLEEKYKDISDQRKKKSLRLHDLCFQLHINYPFEDTYINIEQQVRNGIKFLFKQGKVKEVLSTINECRLLEKEMEDIQKQRSDLNLQIEDKKDQHKKNKEGSKIKYENGALILEKLDNQIHEISELQGKELDEEQLYLVHCTDLFPGDRRILSNNEGKKIIKVSSVIDDKVSVERKIISNRHTVHFTVNNKVGDAGGYGSWGDTKYIIIEPYLSHKRELVDNSAGADSFTDDSVSLSDKAIVMIREDAYRELTKKNKEMYNFVVYKENSTKSVQTLFKMMNIPIIKHDANSANHAWSKYAELEIAFDWRDYYMNWCFKDGQKEFFTAEEMSLLYLDKQPIIKRAITTETLRKVQNKLKLPEEMVRFIISYGIVPDGDKFRFLSYRETEQNLDNPDYYINAFNSVDKDAFIKGLMNHSVYTNNGNNEISNKMTVGELQFAKNMSTLKKLVRELKLGDKEVIKLKQDGIYLKTYDKDLIEYDEELLGNTETTLTEVLANYHILNKGNYDDNTEKTK